MPHFHTRVNLFPRFFRPQAKDRLPPVFGFCPAYSLHNASMGFSFDAFMAGTSPNTTPMTIENATAMIHAVTLVGGQILRC